MHTHIRKHTYTHTYTHKHTHTHTHTYTHYSFICPSICLFVSLIHTDTHIYTVTHIHTVNILIHTCNTATQREEKDIHTMIGMTAIHT